MNKKISNFYKRTSFIILAIIISGLLNVCMFSLQAKAAAMPMPIVNFANNSGNACVAEPVSAPTQTVNYPSAPIPECCLAQNRNFDAMVNTANDKTTTSSVNSIIYVSDNLNAENNYTYYTSQIVFPPPATLALASTVIRE